MTHRGPDQVGQSLGQGHPGHGAGIQQPQNRPFSDGRGGAGGPEVALGDDRNVGERQLERTDALLPGDQTGHAAVHLVGQEPLGPHRNQPKHPLQRLPDRHGAGQPERPQLRRHPLELEDLARHGSQHLVQLQVHRSRSVPLVEKDDAPVTRDPADEGGRNLLPPGEIEKEPGVVRSQQQSVLLLVFGHPDLQNRQRLVSDGDLAKLDPGPRRLGDLLEHVAVSAGALVVDADDGVPFPHLHAGADHPVDLLLHLGVAALDGVEVQFGHVLPLHHAGGGSPAQTDAIGGASDLDHPHPRLGRFLAQVAGVDLSQAPGEHDGLDPLAPLAVRQPQAERAGKALDQRFPELVAVVGGAVAGLDFDLERRGQVLRISEFAVLPGQLVPGNTQVAHTVGGRPGHHQGSLPRGVDVPDAPAGSRLRSGKGSHSRREVVGFGGENDVVIHLSGRHRSRTPRLRGEQGLDPVSANRAGVVPKSHDAVARIGPHRLLDQFQQRRRLLLSVDHHPALEEPVTRVLAVGLGDVEALHVGGIAAHPASEQVGVVVQVPVVEGETGLPVQPLQGGSTLLENRDPEAGFGADGAVERREGRDVGALGHPVVDQFQETAPLALREPFRPPQKVPPRSFDPGDLLQTAGLANRNGIGAPGRLEAQAGPYFETRALAGEKGPLTESIRLEGLAQEPGQDRLAFSVQWAGGFHVEAVLGFDPADLNAERRADLPDQLPLVHVGEHRSPVELNQHESPLRALL